MRYGWISIDNRPSGGVLDEMDYFTCPHCNRMVCRFPGVDRHFCHKCAKQTCDAKFCVEHCNPFVLQLLYQ